MEYYFGYTILTGGKWDFSKVFILSSFYDIYYIGQRTNVEFLPITKCVHSNIFETKVKSQGESMGLVYTVS